MSLAQRMSFLEEVFQITAIVLVSVINHYHINFETPCIYQEEEDMNVCFFLKDISVK